MHVIKHSLEHLQDLILTLVGVITYISYTMLIRLLKCMKN